MSQEQRAPRRMIAGAWFWLEKAIIKDHVSKIGSTAFAVYAFLASYADERQTCFPSQGHIAANLGFHRSTVGRALDRLEKTGLITRETVLGRTHMTLSAIPPDSAVDSDDEECTGAPDVSHQRTEAVAPAHTNNNQRTRIINNQYRREISFASFLADALDDRNGLSVYQAYARRYPEEMLRKVLAEVRDVPTSKLKKRPSHLFAYLLKKYAQ